MKERDDCEGVESRPWWLKKNGKIVIKKVGNIVIRQRNGIELKMIPVTVTAGRHLKINSLVEK